MNAIGYVRVSTEDQAKEGVSLDNQRSKTTAYCQLKDLDLSEIVEDAGISAKNLRRPGVQKVLRLACRREVLLKAQYSIPSACPAQSLVRGCAWVAHHRRRFAFGEFSRKTEKPLWDDTNNFGGQGSPRNVGGLVGLLGRSRPKGSCRCRLQNKFICMLEKRLARQFHCLRDCVLSGTVVPLFDDCFPSQALGDHFQHV